MRTRSHSPAPSGPGLSQIAFDTPSRPKPCTRPARRSVLHVAGGESEPRPRPRPAARRPPGRARACTATSGRRSRRSPTQRRVELVVATAARRAPARRRSPRPTSARRRGRRGSRRRRPRQQPAERGIELRARPACGPARRRRRRRRRGAPPRRTRRAARAAPRSGSRRPRARPGQPRPSHCSYDAPTAVLHGVAAARAARPALRASAACRAIIPSRSRCPESANSSPIRNRCSGGFPRAEPAQRGHRCRQAARLVVVLVRLQRDVVAEPLRLLVGVGVAADVDQQRRVVDDRRARPRRARRARRAAARSGTGAARAPSAGRSRGRCRATARRRARPAGPAGRAAGC